MTLFSQLAEITGGRILNFSRDRQITALLTDSRKSAVDDGALFFAIHGKHHDGHQYLQHLYDAGVRQFVVERELPKAELLKDANVLLASSSLTALQRLAGHRRMQMDIPVVGITGSNGKTIVKEWLFQLLSGDYKIAKNPGSYNSQLGVPLSLWQLQPHHQMGIFEAGISRAGEMEHLASIMLPTIGIFTNAGPAHAEGFKSLDQKIEEKLKLFAHARILIYCKDHKSVDKAIERSGLSALSWGFAPTSGIPIKKSDTGFYVSIKGTSFHLTLPFSDKASVENCFHCIALMMHLDYSPAQIQQRIQLLQSVPMRLEIKDGINQSQVIDDSYNNDLAGLQISLEFLAGQQQKNKKRLILSDIFESGLDNDTLVRQVANMVEKNRINEFVGIGPALMAGKEFFAPGSKFYADTQDFLDHFNWQDIRQEVILVKGARVFQFEKIIERLQRKVHGTVMEIDLGAVVHNLNFFKARLNPATKIMVMVKAFGYGSGTAEIANLLQYHKVDYLGVAYADEGIDLRSNNITLPIMVMNPTEESFPVLLQHRLEPEVYSFNILERLIAFLQRRPCAIHVKLDTGMHRLGFDGSDIDRLIALLKEHPTIRVASIFSHLAGADESSHDAFSAKQAKSFLENAEKISDALGYRPIFHIINSAGILRLPQFQFDMVRLGIGLYGIDPTGEKTAGLRPVATLKTIISQIRTIGPGDTIGYGRKGKAEQPMKVATIAIGYADGFSRAFSRGVGRVLIHGQTAPVVGNVCMDMTMVDITAIDAREGDPVTIFGPEMPIASVAESINTIPYEILTNTSERVKRVFVAESL